MVIPVKEKRIQGKMGPKKTTNKNDDVQDELS